MTFLLAFVMASFELGSGVSFLHIPAAANEGAVPTTAAPSPVKVRFIPMSLGSSEAQTGPGAEAGTWHVEVCNRGEDVAIPRPMIMETVSLRYLPEEFVSALLNQRTQRTKGAIAKSFLKWGMLAGGLTAAILGSQGGAVAGYVVGNFLDYGPKAEAAIELQKYVLPNPLPREVFLRAGTCAEYNILAARVRGAAVMGPYPVRIKEQ